MVWYAPKEYVGWLTHGLAWLLLLAGPRPVLELALHSRRTASRSDAAQLARLTRVPQSVWILLWLGATVGSLAVGIVWMLPGVLPIS